MMTALLWRTGEALQADAEFANFARELERENAALRRLIDDPNAMHSHYLRECNGWEVWQAERIRRFQDASEQLEQLERENAELREQLAQMRSVINEMADRFGRPEFKTRLFDDFMRMRRDLRRDGAAQKETKP